MVNPGYTIRTAQRADLDRVVELLLALLLVAVSTTAAVTTTTAASP